VITPNPADRAVMFGGDFYGQYTADSTTISDRLWHAQLPLWNPYSAAGAPFAASLEVGVWYPLRWLAVLIAGPGGWGVETLMREVAARYWLVSLMTYAFFRQLRRRPEAALAGSVGFTYGGYLTGYPMPQVSVLDSAMWLPLALIGAHLAGSSPRHGLRGSLLAGAALALSILAGHPQTTLFVAYLTLAYLIFTARQNGIGWPGAAGRAGLLLVTSGGLAAVLLLPAAQFTGLATRLAEYGIAQKGAGYALGDLFQIIWPGVFVALWSPLYPGVAAFVLALAAILRPNGERIFWAVALGLGLGLVVGDRLGLYRFFYALAPGFDLFRQQERFAVVIAFAFAALAADRLDSLLGPPGEPGTPHHSHQQQFGWLVGGHLALTWSAALVVVVGGMARRSPLDDPANATLFVALISACLAGWWLLSRRGQARFAGLALVAIIALDLFTVGLHTANFVPDTPDNRPAQPGAKRLMARDAVEWHVDGAAGLNGYGTYFRIPDIYPGSANILELQSVYDLRSLPVDRFWEVLAVRYVTLPDEVTPPPAVRLRLLATDVNLQGQFYQLYELTDPRPFAWLVYDGRVAGDAAAARALIADPSINLRQVAVSIGPLPISLPGARPADSRVANFKMATPERIEMTVSTGENALLTLAVPVYPGWRASVNGQPVVIANGYAGLIGIPIHPGDGQQVVLEYAPTLQLLAGAISLLALLAVIALGVWERRRPVSV
jgi:hypothetical protein